MPKNQNKIKSVTIKVSEKEQEMLQKGAEMTGLPVSQFILYSCNTVFNLSGILSNIDQNLTEINEKLSKL